MRVLASSVLVFEALVIFFATLVASDLSDLDPTTLWLVGCGASLACLVVAGLLRHRWAYVLGSALQVLVIGAGFVVTAMFFLGALFAALWVVAIVLGRRVQRLEAQR